MKVLISGATGFIGTALCQQLPESVELIVRTRNTENLTIKANAVRTLDELGSDEKIDVAINLAGEPIADKRWSPQQKQRIIQSRLSITEEFISFFQRAQFRPKYFISGSAIGYYGVSISNEECCEESASDSSFSSKLCTAWEQTALQAETLGISTCLLRTGIVLGHGGALAKMLPPFQFGLGGKIGSGKQWMPWIHIDDMIGIIMFCIFQQQLTGAINCCAPNPVTNADFTKMLGKHIKRPTVFAMPAALVKLLFGEMAEELLLSGKKVIPKRLEQSHYQFRYPELNDAFNAILN